MLIQLKANSLEKYYDVIIHIHNTDGKTEHDLYNFL